MIIGGSSMSKKIRIISLIFVTIIILGVSYKNIMKCIYPLKYSAFVEKYSKEYDLDKYLIYSIIKTESKFKEDAVSYKKAKGLMQISDVTASWGGKELGIENVDIFDPETNINIGAWYLNRLEDEFDGNLELAITAYNGGSGNVRKWLKDKRYSRDGKNLQKIPFKETSDYTYKVLKNYERYKSLYRK